MLIAIVNGQTVEQVGDANALFPNTSFPSTGISDSFLTENNAKKVNVFKPYDANTQKLVSVDPYVEGEWVYTVDVEALTPEDIVARQASEAAQNKSKAEAILTKTDWTSAPDVADPLKSEPYLTNQAEFISYRSVIRAIAVTPTYDAFFPDVPKTAWSNDPIDTKITINTGTGSSTVTI